MSLIQKSISKTTAAARLRDDERVGELERVVQDFKNREEFVAEITRLWRQAQEKFLVIGRYLLKAKATLPHGDYESMIDSDLPFGRKTAFQIRAAAEAIDSRRLLPEEAPPSYATVYALASLSDEQLAMARARGLVRPTISRPAVLAFKKSLKTDLDPTAPLRQRLEQLLERRRKLDAEINRIKLQLGAEIIEYDTAPAPEAAQ
ncbi:MAG: hypothetical protein P4M00_16780 [Azospirillaceae bacterium]|nr:hypothetical protein [Azospirillaceae bacterium]